MFTNLYNINTVENTLFDKLHFATAYGKYKQICLKISMAFVSLESRFHLYTNDALIPNFKYFIFSIGLGCTNSFLHLVCFTQPIFCFKYFIFRKVGTQVQCVFCALCCLLFQGGLCVVCDFSFFVPLCSLTMLSLGLSNILSDWSG